MKRERARELLPVIQAYADGKVIQTWETQDQWIDGGEASFRDGFKYRIKPEPKLRAWTRKECPQAFIIQSKSADCRANIAIKQSGYDHVRLIQTFGEVGIDRISFAELLEHWCRIAEDGTEHPCGVLEQP